MTEYSYSYTGKTTPRRNGLPIGGPFFIARDVRRITVPRASATGELKQIVYKRIVNNLRYARGQVRPHT